MTDKEKAEEWVGENGFGSDCNNINSVEANTAMVNAYLAGLKAKWHKVDDEDLPKVSEPCLVYLVNDCIMIARLREDNIWTTKGHNAFENVIAWCEIPKFTEEN